MNRTPLLADARLVRLRVVASQTGCGWTCVRGDGQAPCTQRGCEAPATHLWVPVHGAVVPCCAVHPAPDWER